MMMHVAKRDGDLPKVESTEQGVDALLQVNFVKTGESCV
jgi:hypothetical protein